MTFKFPARVGQTSTTTGTGTLTLSGSSGAKRTYNEQYGSGPILVPYCIGGAAYYEIGWGTFTAPSTLTRDTVILSSNSNNKVSLPSATHDVFAWEMGAAMATDTWTGSSRTLTVADWGNVQLFTGSSATVLIPPAFAAMPDGWNVIVHNSGSATLTIDPPSSETIEGGTTLLVTPGEWIYLYRDGSQLRGLAGGKGGYDIRASSSTVDLSTSGASRPVRISGNTTISSFGTSRAGEQHTLIFTGALTVVHNASAIVLQGGRNLEVVAGDTLTVVYEGAGVWRQTGGFFASEYIFNIPTRVRDSVDAGFGSIVQNNNTGYSASAYLQCSTGTTNSYFQISARDIAGTPDVVFGTGAAITGLIFNVNNYSFRSQDNSLEWLRIDGATGRIITGGMADQGSYRFQCDSQIWAASATIATSDLRLKDVIGQPTEYLLRDIGNLPIVVYRRKDRPEDGIRAGFGAQNVLEILERHGLGDHGIVQKTTAGALALDESAVQTLLVAALRARLARAEERIAALENRIG